MRNWTEAQRRAIETQGNLIVSAAAGAGKTAVLTERLTRIVASGTPVDRLLVLTFTRAAAAEMKQRIEKNLRDAAARAQTAEQQAYLRAQAGAIGRAYISTIDAFCARVLRRHGHRIDLPPAMRVLDELEAPVLSERVKDALLTAFGAEENAHWRALLAAFGSEDAAWAAVAEISTFLQTQPEPEAWLERATLQYAESAWIAQMLRLVTDDARSALSESLRALQAVRDTLPPDWAGVIGVLDADLLSLRAALLQQDYDAYRAALLAYAPGRLTFPRGTAEADKADVKDARDALKKLIAAQQAQFSRTAEQESALLLRTGEVLASLRAVVEAYRDAYADEKRRLGALDYADLEHLALRLLGDEAVAAEYRERFLYIAVDEYQDSNRVQEALLDAVRRPDNLFLVGDVKQSIYRFRQAEPGLFLEKLDRFCGEAGTRIDLTSNFRSAPDVLACVNDVFSAILTREAGELDYDARARLEPGLAQLQGGAELHVIERGGAEPEAAADTPPDAVAREREEEEDASSTDAAEDALDAEIEARLAARRIRELMASETIPDRETGQPRPLRYGDFAILLRATDEAVHFAATLSQAGIPCYAQMSGGYFDSIEVMLALNLLRVIDNRRQDIPLLSVLRATGADTGPFSAEELSRIRMREREGTFFAAFEAAASAAKGGAGDTLCQRCASFLACLECWREDSLLLPLDALLGRLYEETGLYAQMGALVGGAQRQANLDALLGRARAFSRGAERGVGAFLRFMDHAGQSSARLGAAQQIGADVVRVLTIHRSKGLEFPVALVCRLGRRFHMDAQRKDLLLHGEAGVGLKWLDGGVQRDTAARRMIAQRLRREQLAEEMRVLYVAMTRAQHRLILIGSWKEAAGLLDRAEAQPSPAQVLACRAPLQWALMGTRAHCPTTVHAREAFLAAPSAQRAEPAVPAPDPDALAALEGRLSWRYPFAEAAALPAKAAVSAIVRQADAQAPQQTARIAFETPAFAKEGAQPGEPASAPLSAAERGTAVHAVLSTLPLLPLSEAAVRAHCAALVRAGQLTEAQEDALPFAALSWLTHTPLWARMAASARCERELPFSHLVPAAELFGSDGAAEAVLLQGVIDCCFWEKAGWVLVDYKTDRPLPGVSPAQQAAGHAPQLALYAEALHRLTGHPVQERLVVLLSARTVVPV